MNLDKVRLGVSLALDRLSAKVRPPHRFLWTSGEPLPEDAKWLECGHPSTDGSDELPSIIHEPTAARRETGWCWWGHGWQFTTEQRLRLVPDERA